MVPALALPLYENLTVTSPDCEPGSIEFIQSVSPAI